MELSLPRFFMILTPELIRSEGMRLLIFQHLRNLQVKELNRKRQLRYNASPKGKERIAQYALKHGDRLKLAQEKYNKTAKAKARLHKYNRTEKFKIKKLRYKLKHPERVKEGDSRRHKAYQASGRALEVSRVWCAKNREKVRAYGRSAGKKRYATSRGKFITVARSRIRAVIKSAGLKMPASASKLIGCDWDTLRKHIESQFTGAMTWANYGKWHVDHVTPISSFDLTDPEQVARCFSWRNMQPLWAFDNLSKGAKLIYIKKNTQPTQSIPCQDHCIEKS